MLFDAFFAAVVSESSSQDLPWGEEVERLAINVEAAASMPSVITQDSKAMADDYAATFGHYICCVGVRYKTGANGSTPQGTRTIQLPVSPTTTSRVVDATKHLGISVTSAVHAAVAAANYKHATPETASNHFTSTIRFTLRPYLPQPYCTSAFAAGLYATGWMHRLDASQTWRENASAVNEVYKRGLGPEFIKVHRQYALNLQDLVKNTPADAPPLSNVDISSIGIMDELLKPKYDDDTRGVQVNNATVGVETLTPQMVMFLWTFRGQMNLYVVYNEAYSDAEMALDFAKSVKEILLNELRVQEV